MRTGKSSLRFTVRELALVIAVVGLTLAWALDHSRLQGSLRHTGEPLHMAIEGEGFFCLTDERTSRSVYTRRGEFSANANGQLVLRSRGIDWPVQPPIQIPSDALAIQITPNGLAIAHLPGTLKTNANGQQCRTVNLSAIGQLQLAMFDHPSKLKPIATSVYADTTASGQPLLDHPSTIKHPGMRKLGSVRQGMIERRQAQSFLFSPWH